LLQSSLRPVWLHAALFSLAILTGPTAQAVGAAAPPQDGAGAEIHRRLAEAGDVVRIDNEQLDAEALRRFYETRLWRPAWTAMADRLLPILATADQDGIPVGQMHVAAIAARHSGGTSQQIAESDLLLTDGLLRYANAMRGQRTDPAEYEDDWFLEIPPFSPVSFLKDHVNDLPTALAGLAAPYQGYQLLKKALADLRAVAAAGDWPKVTAGPPLKPGASDARIVEVRRRLAATGEWPADGDTASELYDEALVPAVQLFQRRHGLTDDGALGPRTIRAMNVSAAERARQVAVNMERWRWLPQRMENDHIVVNVPAAQMEVVENGVAVMAMKVVIGDPDHPTPALRARMTSIVLNPIWRVPASIATNEFLPKLKKDPGYLIANDLELVSDNFRPGSPESQGVGINWHDMNAMPWPVRQKAGSDNSLGRIKFNIPNSDDIYLHDTPNHKAFNRNDRALSHGCVRLERPEDLALYVLRDKDWSRDRLEEEIGKGGTHTVTLNKTLPVWLLYWTVWVDADGVLQTRDDVYERDEHLASALGKANRSPLLADRTQKLIPKTVNCDGCRVP
jgi:murein L,D-transpeptidase YcbB/YkuD